MVAQNARISRNIKCGPTRLDKRASGVDGSHQCSWSHLWVKWLPVIYMDGCSSPTNVCTNGFGKARWIRRMKVMDLWFEDSIVKSIHSPRETSQANNGACSMSWTVAKAHLKCWNRKARCIKHSLYIYPRSIHVYLRHFRTTMYVTVTGLDNFFKKLYFHISTVES